VVCWLVAHLHIACVHVHMWCVVPGAKMGRRTPKPKAQSPKEQPATNNARLARAAAAGCRAGKNKSPIDGPQGPGARPSCMMDDGVFACAC
jgi:hypothetical protein